MMNQTEVSTRTHRRAVRFFWGFLIGATTISLAGNITHAVLSYIPRVVVQIGAATVPPIALLAAVHGIAVAVRAGASGTVYRWAVSAVAIIGMGAFTVSFLALRDLMLAIGYSAETAWIFPAIIDTAVAVSTMMLVALGDKTSTSPTPIEGVRRCVTAHDAAGDRPYDAECKVPGDASFTQHARTIGAIRADTNLCIGATRSGANHKISANRCRTGRCRACVGSHCIPHNYSADRDGDRGTGSTQ